MDRVLLEGYAARLQDTGLNFARGTSHDGGANLAQLVDVPWDQAIVRIISLTGWRVVDEEGVMETPILKLE